MGLHQAGMAACQQQELSTGCSPHGVTVPHQHIPAWVPGVSMHCSRAMECLLLPGCSRVLGAQQQCHCLWALTQVNAVVKYLLAAREHAWPIQNNTPEIQLP